MIRIVGVEHCGPSGNGFVLLQNQGTMRQKLRGHLLISESNINESLDAYAFPDDEHIPSGAYVLLHCGCGESRWSRSKDGALIYVTFLSHEVPLLGDLRGPLHLLNIQHSYQEARAAVCV